MSILSALDQIILVRTVQEGSRGLLKNSAHQVLHGWRRYDPRTLLVTVQSPVFCLSCRRLWWQKKL